MPSALGGSTIITIPPARVRPCYTLAELLAQCEPGPFEADRDWIDAPAVGKEFGSPEWDKAEQEGRLKAFLNSPEPSDAPDYIVDEILAKLQAILEDED